MIYMILLLTATLHAGSSTPTRVDSSQSVLMQVASVKLKTQSDIRVWDAYATGFVMGMSVLPAIMMHKEYAATPVPVQQQVSMTMAWCITVGGAMIGLKPHKKDIAMLNKVPNIPAGQKLNISDDVSLIVGRICTQLHDSKSEPLVDVQAHNDLCNRYNAILCKTVQSQSFLYGLITGAFVSPFAIGCALGMATGFFQSPSFIGDLD